MAIFYTDLSRSFGPKLGIGAHRQPVILATSVAVTTAMIDNVDDEVALFWAPAGFVVIGVQLSATDMDTGTPTLAFDIGDDADEDRLVAASTVGQAGTTSSAIARTGHLYRYTADTLVKAYVQAVAATAAAGTLSVTITGFIDPQFSSTGLTATTTAG